MSDSQVHLLVRRETKRRIKTKDVKEFGWLLFGWRMLLKNPGTYKTDAMIDKQVSLRIVYTSDEVSHHHKDRRHISNEVSADARDIGLPLTFAYQVIIFIG